MSTQTEIFRRIVSDRLGEPPVCIASDTTVRQLVERLTQQATTSAVVVDGDGRPVGIVTEQDVTRRVAFRADPETPVSAVMSAPVVTVDRERHLYRAIAFMRRHKLRHIPVLNDEGRVCGMLSLHEALEYLSEPTMELIEALTHEETLEGLRAVKAAQAELAQALFDDHVPVPEVQRLLTDINRDLHRRILRRRLAEMESESRWGKPPVGFALIILGSGGRGENFLFPDQDNGFILDDYPDREHARIDAFFVELAERMTRDLDAVGLPFCQGYVMATNPLWRKTLTQWKAQLAYWMRRHTPATLRHCDIFFDFTSAFGEIGHAEALRRYVTEIAQKNPRFIRDMFDLQKDHRVALGWFGRILKEEDSKGRRGLVNLKYRGTLPLVEAVRLLALRHGIAETSTLDRLDRLREGEVIGRDEHDYLTGGLNHLTHVLLRQQLKDFRSGNEVTYFVPVASLSRRERDQLAGCFRAVRDLRTRLELDFAVSF